MALSDFRRYLSDLRPAAASGRRPSRSVKFVEKIDELETRRMLSGSALGAAGHAVVQPAVKMVSGETSSGHATTETGHVGADAQRAKRHINLSRMHSGSYVGHGRIIPMYGSSNGDTNLNNGANNDNV
jgi:hypothetical protein